MAAEPAGKEPDHVAFRMADDGLLLAVVAALDAGDRPSFPWAHWYHGQTPRGEYAKVPDNYARLRVDETVAKRMIERIARGQPPPPGFVAALLIV